MGRIISGIRRRLDFSDKARVKRIIKNPPAVRPDTIVFASSPDYSGNPKALFQYMMENGYGEKYKFIWLFERKENMFDFGLPNVSTACIWNKKGEKSPAAQKAILKGRYVFYSHNVNWCKLFRPEQTFIDLWHGCGYKGKPDTEKRKLYYDYMMVTGRKYIDITRGYLKDPDGVMLDLGYPRNESLFTKRSHAAEFLEDMKKAAGADKAVIWMPTFRKSRLPRLDTGIEQGSTGLPVLYEEKDIQEFDEWCRKEKVLVILKQHDLAAGYDYAAKDYTNLLLINDKYLMKHDADLYEMLGCSDALLTDYSSVATDYLLTDKPLGYTLDDYDEYEARRGFSFDNVKDFMPGHHIYTTEDMKAFISDIAAGKDPHSEWRARVTSEAHTYRDGFSKRILDYFNI